MHASFYRGHAYRLPLHLPMCNLVLVRHHFVNENPGLLPNSAPEIFAKSCFIKTGKHCFITHDAVGTYRRGPGDFFIKGLVERGWMFFLPYQRKLLIN
jgi:hypothetical protein